MARVRGGDRDCQRRRDARAGRPPRRNLVAVVSIVVLSGAFFGYDQGVISGALRDIRQTFHANTFAVEVAASWVTPGR